MKWFLVIFSKPDLKVPAIFNTFLLKIEDMNPKIYSIDPFTG